ncbi:hypothetical protein R3P38DRAFT_3202587 [Favolaschia claudopus]|uniref:3'-5' exonuclease domain-containing protein n=1 Tax=Favolaschia claudopus TaxID=2862362 RepID=A0AAW0AW77_9AGAR
MDSQEPRFAPDSAAIRINLGSTDLAPLELTFKAFLLTDVEEANKHLDSIQSHSVVGLDTEYKVNDAPERQPTPRGQALRSADSGRAASLRPRHDRHANLPGRFTQNPGGPVDHKMRRGLKLRRSSALDGTARQCPQLPRCRPHGTHCLPVYYRKVANPLSMQRCVGDILHRVMDKTDQKGDWHLGLTDTTGGRDVQKLFRYAALDAQASLEVYRVLDDCLLETAMQRKVYIPANG